MENLGIDEGMNQKIKILQNSLQIPIATINKFERLRGFIYYFSPEINLQDLAHYTHKNQLKKIWFRNTSHFNVFGKSNYNLMSKSLKDFLLSQANTLEEVHFDSKCPVSFFLTFIHHFKGLKLLAISDQNNKLGLMKSSQSIDFSYSQLSSKQLDSNFKITYNGSQVYPKEQIFTFYKVASIYSPEN